MSKNKILLESGTGEMEILNFTLNETIYSINVLKVKELLKVNKESISRIPNSPEAVLGIALIRGEALTLINLGKYLNDEIENFKEKQNIMVIVAEFNNTKIGFVVDIVLGIKRIEWSEIEKPTHLGKDSLVIGNIKMDDKILMLLDYENIVQTNQPQDLKKEKRIDLKEKNINVIVAEDSNFVRQTILGELEKSNINLLQSFDNGEDALNYFLNNQQSKNVDILISDIEMPKLDGLSLIKRLRDTKEFKDLGTIVYSSLVSDGLAHKGEAVGADEQITKPQLYKLVGTIEKVYNKRN